MIENMREYANVIHNFFDAMEEQEEDLGDLEVEEKVSDE